LRTADASSSRLPASVLEARTSGLVATYTRLRRAMRARQDILASTLASRRALRSAFEAACPGCTHVQCPCVRLWLDIAGSCSLSLTAKPRQRPCSATSLSALCNRRNDRTALRWPPMYPAAGAACQCHHVWLLRRSVISIGTHRVVRRAAWCTRAMSALTVDLLAMSCDHATVGNPALASA